MVKKKLLLAGGGYADIPMIQAARSLGFHVITSGNRPGDLGHAHADEVRLADFSDREAMLALARELRIDAICASCNDFSALSAAYVAEKMGLPGHDPIETAEIIHHKDRYREFAHRHDIPTPRAEGFSTVDEAIDALPRFRLPLIIKPVDLTGGKGISVADTAESYANGLRAAFSISRAKRVVVEEFVRGSRHGLSTFLRNGKVVFAFADDEHYFLNPYMVSGASTPTSAPDSAIATLKRQAEGIASLLRLKDGIFHIQFILGDDGPVIIEICRRPPGDLYVRLVELATGVPYPAYLIRAAAGLDCGDLAHTEPQGYFTRHCMMANATGILEDIVFDPSIRDNVIDQMSWWQSGQSVDDILTQKFGIVFLRYQTQDEMQSKMERLTSLIDVRLRK